MEEYIYIFWAIFFVVILISAYLIGASHNRGKALNQTYSLQGDCFLVIYCDYKTALIESIETKVRFLISSSVVQGYFKRNDVLKKIKYRSKEFEERKLEYFGFDPLVKFEIKNAE